MPDASSQMPGASRVGNRKERGSARSAMGVIRLPLYVIVWVRLFTRNTLRDVPYSCSIVPHPVRNAALPVPLWE